MRILVLGVNYAPEMTGIGQMTTEFAEELVARGHEVVVATTFAFYPEWRWSRRPPLRRVETLNGVSVRRFRIILPKNSGAAWRVVHDTSYVLSIIPNLLNVARPDCIVAVSPPVQVGIVAALLRSVWRSRVCLVVKDLPLEAALDVGMMRKGLLLRGGLALERWAYKLADHIVAIDDRFRVNIETKGLPSGGITVIPNWVDLKGMQPGPADAELRRRLGVATGEVLALHTGNMGEKQSLLNVVQAAAHLRDSGRFKFLLVGEGSQRALIEQAIHERGLDDVRLLPLQPAELYKGLLRSADVMLLNQRGNVIDSVAPHKLLSYMAAGRAVVAAAHAKSVAGRLVTEAGCGIVIEPDDPAALAEGIRWLSESPVRRQAMGDAGRAYAERTFGKSALMDRWEELLRRLARPTSHPSAV